MIVTPRGAAALKADFGMRQVKTGGERWFDNDFCHARAPRQN
jgi:hypothetical protein